MVLPVEGSGAGSPNVTPVVNGNSPLLVFGRADSNSTPVNTKSENVAGNKRKDCVSCLTRVCWCHRIGPKSRKFIPREGPHPDIFSPENLKDLNLKEYGSMGKKIEELLALREKVIKQKSSAPHVVINLDDDDDDDDVDDLGGEKKSLHLDIDTTKIVDLDCAPDQSSRKENLCSASEADIQKEQDGGLNVEATDGTDTNVIIVDVEVDQDSGVNLGLEADNAMEKGNAQTPPSCEDLDTISEFNEDEGIDLGLKAEVRMDEADSGGPFKVREVNMDDVVDLTEEVDDGMESGNGHANANYENLAKIPEFNEDEGIDLGLKAEVRMDEADSGGPSEVPEVNMDGVVDLTAEVDDGMEKYNGHANVNHEHLAKSLEIDIINLGLEARDVVWDNNEQTAYNGEGTAKISEFSKGKGVYVGFSDDEKVEEENGQLDLCSDGLSEISKVNKDKGEYVGIPDDEEDNEQLGAGRDDIFDIWNEMGVALECSKDTAEDSLNEQHAIEDEEACDHSFILKDDIGYVCRICGLIQRAIETIIEFQYTKGKKSGRTYRYEGSSEKDLEQTKGLPGIKFSDHDFAASELAVHPRHGKLMKPHQVEGFNFLLSNLVADNPGGCIMAHAPGSGKTFMIISFLQSFMAKYPAARPLIVLPRGILSTWKKEFQRWQVEDIPLYDFYSSKAENRSQQLQVLQQWVSERSILFLGYKQFSSIICDSDPTRKIASACEEILLTCPSILILDEGHTPRNQDTDILRSLEKVQTPRKVVLSGTLYQNHVEEVFNILNLVRPRFLKLDSPKMIKRRIMSKVPLTGRKSSLKSFSNNDFYDAVEGTLLKDEPFNRKVAVIKDLREMTSKVLHYYKGDSLDELPGLVDFTIFLELGPKQKVEVAKLKQLKNLFKRISDGSNIYVHPQLKALSEYSAKERVNEDKIDMILEDLDEREGVKAKFYLNLLRLCESSGEKMLVFSQYLLPLKFLERLTVKVMGYSPGKEIFMITGDSDAELRDSYMDQFNKSSNARVFFGSIKACGEGISLVGASRIIVLDMHLNPSVTRQAIGRAFRPGQVRKVYTYRLVAADSPEVDDHLTCFKKETISKLWFEWNGCLGERDFEMETINANESGDLFLETASLSEDVVSVFKR